MVNYLRRKFFLTTYPLARVHPLQTNGQTDRRTDDNHDNSSTARSVKT